MSGPAMPFGRYRGALLRDLPEAYLAWLLGPTVNLREPLKTHVLAEADRRAAEARRATEPPPSASAPVNGMLAERVIDTGFRVLARRTHPDVGGSSEAMRDLLAAREFLKECVGSLACR